MSKTFEKWATAALSAAVLAFSSVPAGAGQILYGVAGAGGGTGAGPGGATSMLYTIDTATGAATLVGDTGFSHVAAIDFHPVTGILYGISNDDGAGNNSLITINPATGAGTFVTKVGTLAENWPDMGFAPDGTLYSWSEPFDDSLHTIDLSTGVATSPGSSGLSTDQSGLDVDSSGVIYFKDGDGSIYTIDPGTGLPTLVVNIGCCNFDNALAFGMNDMLYTIDRDTGGAYLYTIDLGTGGTTLIGSTGVSTLSGLAFRTTPEIPEPSVLALFLIGLIGIQLGRAGRAR